MWTMPNWRRFLPGRAQPLAQDLTPRIGKFGNWIQASDIEAIHRWTARWT